MKIQLIRQSMLLCQSQHVTFLIDPFFKPVNFPIKIPPPALTIAQIPPCEFVLATHGDMDHFDIDVVCGRWPDLPVIVPPGLETEARKRGARHVVSLPNWETYTHGDVSVTAVPAEHHGSPACGYVIAAQEGKRFYTSGDTLWVQELAHIPERCGKLDAAFIPVIGIRMWGRQTIWSPSEAARAVAALGPDIVVPVHLDAFIRLPLFGGMFGSVGEFETALASLGAPARVRRVAAGQQLEL